jgi:hypothetical protein
MSLSPFFPSESDNPGTLTKAGVFAAFSALIPNPRSSIFSGRVILFASVHIEEGHI